MIGKNEHYGFCHRFRMLNWKGPLEFNSAPYFHKKLKPRDVNLLSQAVMPS